MLQVNRFSFLRFRFIMKKLMTYENEIFTSRHPQNMLLPQNRNKTKLNKAWGLQLYSKRDSCKACNFIKKRLQHRCFPVKFAKFLRTLPLAASGTGISTLLNEAELK